MSAYATNATGERCPVIKSPCIYDIEGKTEFSNVTLKPLKDVGRLTSRKFHLAFLFSSCSKPALS